MAPSFLSSAGTVAVLLQRAPAPVPHNALTNQLGLGKAAPRQPAPCWVASQQGTAMLSISASADSCMLKLTCKDHTLLDHDLFERSGPPWGLSLRLNLLQPRDTGANWLLLISPEVRCP